MRAHDSYWSPLLSPYPSPFQVGREIPWRCSSNIVYVEEPLLNSLEKKLSGIQFNDPFPTKEVTEAYCDDINIITNDLNDFSKIEVEVREFERLSGAILSRSQKSMVMGIGRWKNREEWPIPWLLSVKSLKVFGIFIAETYNEIMKLNWEYRLNKFVNAIFSWSARRLSTLHQKIEVVRVFGLSRTYYVASILPIKKCWVNKFESQKS